MQFEAISSRYVLRKYTRGIEEDIISGAIGPRAALLSENNLAEQVGFNHSTVCEAVPHLRTNVVRRERGRKTLSSRLCAPAISRGAPIRLW